MLEARYNRRSRWPKAQSAHTNVQLLATRSAFRCLQLLQPQDAEARAAQQAATRRDGCCWIANRRHKATQQPQYPNHTTEKWFTHAQKLHPSEGPTSSAAIQLIFVGIEQETVQKRY